MSETEFTNRGFAYQRFHDFNGTECVVQKSSIATDDCIWLGAREIGLKRFEPYVGWSDVPTPAGPEGVSYVANNRMHLSREQMAKLLPVLQHFVETGDLPDITPPAEKEAK